MDLIGQHATLRPWRQADAPSLVKYANNPNVARQLRDRFHLGILLIEHDMKLVMGVCEELCVLDHGETIARGRPEQVQKDRRVIEAYLGDSYLAEQGTLPPGAPA